MSAITLITLGYVPFSSGSSWTPVRTINSPLSPAAASVLQYRLVNETQCERRPASLGQELADAHAQPNCLLAKGIYSDYNRGLLLLSEHVCTAPYTFNLPGPRTSNLASLAYLAVVGQWL